MMCIVETFLFSRIIVLYGLTSIHASGMMIQTRSADSAGKIFLRNFRGHGLISMMNWYGHDAFYEWPHLLTVIIAAWQAYWSSPKSRLLNCSLLCLRYSACAIRYIWPCVISYLPVSETIYSGYIQIWSHVFLDSTALPPNSDQDVRSNDHVWTHISTIAYKPSCCLNTQHTRVICLKLRLSATNFISRFNPTMDTIRSTQTHDRDSQLVESINSMNVCSKFFFSRFRLS